MPLSGDPAPAPASPSSSSPFALSALPWWRRPSTLIIAVALVVSFAAYGATLGGYFLGDDFGYVGKFHNFPFTSWPRLFVNEWSEGLWGFQLRELRPMTALTLIVDGHLWGANATGYRVTNLLIHAATASIVGLIAWRVSGRTLLCGLAAAVFFALHPAHAEPVLWITGRVDMVCTLFYVAGFAVFLCYRDHGGRGWMIAVWASYFAAAFSKEFGLTLPIMMLVADLTWRQSWRRWREWPTWAPYAGCVGVFIFYYFCRRAAFTAGGVGIGLPDFTSTEFHTQFSQRELTYVAHLFPPMQQWFNDQVPAYAQHAIRTLLFTAAVALTLLAVWRWLPGKRSSDDRRAGLFFGLGWYLVATLPLIITYVSGRHLYLASAGVCVAAALIFHSLFRHHALFVVAALALAAGYAWRFPGTVSPWADSGTCSRDTHLALVQVDRESQRGGALLVDVPEMVRGAYMWTWGIPFAARPPFVSARLDDRLAILESPGLYVDWGVWHTQPSVAALQKVDQTGWIIRAGEDRVVRVLTTTPEKIREASTHFAASPTKPSPHAAWRTLVAESLPPASPSK